MASIPVPETPCIQRIRKPSRYVCDLQSIGFATGFANRSAIPEGLQVLVEKSQQRDEVIEEVTLVVDIGDVKPFKPKSLADVKQHPDWPNWEHKICEELKTLEDSGTWELTDSPPGANIVGSKWVFLLKTRCCQSYCYKARLVAQGFSQVEEVDYFDTYAPVAKLASLHMILALAAHLNLELHQVDIKGAYLNGVLTDDEVIYMCQLPGYPYPNSSGKVLQLHKTIYGLKQSGWCWYQKLTEICTEALGFQCCNVDQAVFYRHDDKVIVVMAAHVDNCMITAYPHKLVDEVKQKLGTQVMVTDLDELPWLLCIDVSHDRGMCTLRISQHTYIEDILRHFNFDDLKPILTPIDPHLMLSNSQSPITPEQSAILQNIPFCEAIGSLMYTSLRTHLDITFAVTCLSKFLQNTRLTHWKAAKHIFYYLKGTKISLAG